MDFGPSQIQAIVSAKDRYISVEDNVDNKTT